MMLIADRWQRFWFSAGDAKILGLLRWGIGAVFLMNRTEMNRLFRLEWSHMVPKFPHYEFATEAQYRIDAYRLPYPGLEWLPVPSLATYQWIEIAIVFLAVLFTLGIRSRITGPLTAILTAYLFLLSQFSYHHGDFALLIAFCCIAFAPAAGNTYSLEQFAGVTPKQTSALVLPIRLLQSLCTAILFFGALNKLNEGWWSGDVLWILSKNNQLAGPIAWIMQHHDALFAVGGILTIACLLFSAIGLWIPVLRRTAIVIGILTQIAIDMTYWNALTFNYLMIVLLCTFMTKDDIRRIRGIIPSSAQAR